MHGDIDTSLPFLIVAGDALCQWTQMNTNLLEPQSMKIAKEIIQFRQQYKTFMGETFVNIVGSRWEGMPDMLSCQQT